MFAQAYRYCNFAAFTTQFMCPKDAEVWSGPALSAQTFLFQYLAPLQQMEFILLVFRKLNKTWVCNADSEIPTPNSGSWNSKLDGALYPRKTEESLNVSYFSIQEKIFTFHSGLQLILKVPPSKF